jgi:hypothetical protein
MCNAHSACYLASRGSSAINEWVQGSELLSYTNIMLHIAHTYV